MKTKDKIDQLLKAADALDSESAGDVPRSLDGVEEDLSAVLATFEEVDDARADLESALDNLSTALSVAEQTISEAKAAVASNPEWLAAYEEVEAVIKKADPTKHDVKSALVKMKTLARQVEHAVTKS